MTTKILMVCLGNICRSPLAEGILASKLPKDSFFIDSAGTGSWHIGNAPDKRSVAVAAKNNIDISKQKGRQFSEEDFDLFDIIYVMDNENYKDVLLQTNNAEHRKKVQLILDAIFPDQKVDVPDPYYGTKDSFEKVFAMLDDACNEISKKLLSSK